GEYASVFLGALTSPYTNQLFERAAWVVDRFQSMPDLSLNEYMRSQWSHWGSEFVHESLFDMDE
ncbi:MAG: threonine transporter, partial [Planctomycetes bacterium]|nr:threonine transporter [Planctomycetota bacterium]